MLRRDDRIDLTDLPRSAAGGYAEQVLAQAGLMEEIPNGLSSDMAANLAPMRC